MKAAFQCGLPTGAPGMRAVRGATRGTLGALGRPGTVGICIWRRRAWMCHENEGGRRDKVELTEELTHSLLKVCQQQRDTLQARRVWEDFTKDWKPSARVIGMYLKVLCSGGEVDLARKVMKEYGHVGGHRGRTSIIGALARSKRVEEALQELYAMEDSEEMRKPYAWTSCLHALSVEGRLDEALQVLQTAEERRVEMDMRMYDAVIRGLGRHGRVDTAFTLVGKARKMGLEATKDTFEGLIYGCGHAGLAGRALVIYDAAKQAGFGVEVAEATASACLKKGFVNDGRVVEIVQVLQRQGYSKKAEDLKRLLSRKRRCEQERGKDWQSGR